MLDIAQIEGVVFGGTILGAFGRTMLPYLQKLKEQEEEEGKPDRPPLFQKKYWFTMAYSLVGSLAIGMTLFPALVPTIAPSSTLTAVIIASALAGWGGNDMVNSFISMATKSGAKQTAKEQKADKDSIMTKALSDKS